MSDRSAGVSPARRLGYRFLGPAFDYLLHLRPAECGIYPFAAIELRQLGAFQRSAWTFMSKWRLLNNLVMSLRQMTFLSTMELLYSNGIVGRIVFNSNLSLLRWDFDASRLALQLGLFIFLAAVLYIPSLREVFGFARLHFDDLAVSLGASIISTLLILVFKLKPNRSI